MPATDAVWATPTDCGTLLACLRAALQLPSLTGRGWGRFLAPRAVDRPAVYTLHDPPLVRGDTEHARRGRTTAAVVAVFGVPGRVG